MNFNCAAIRRTHWSLFLFSLLPALIAAENPSYRGFTIDESRVSQLPAIEAIRTAMKEQIDIVCAVGLPADTLKFFQGVPFVFLPAEALPRTALLFAAPNRHCGTK